LTQSADKLSIQHTGHDVRSVSPLWVSEWRWRIYGILFMSFYLPATAYQNKNYF